MFGRRRAENRALVRRVSELVLESAAQFKYAETLEGKVLELGSRVIDLEVGITDYLEVPAGRKGSAAARRRLLDVVIGTDDEEAQEAQ